LVNPKNWFPAGPNLSLLGEGCDIEKFETRKKREEKREMKKRENREDWTDERA